MRCAARLGRKSRLRDRRRTVRFGRCPAFGARVVFRPCLLRQRSRFPSDGEAVPVAVSRDLFPFVTTTVTDESRIVRSPSESYASRADSVDFRIIRKHSGRFGDTFKTIPSARSRSDLEAESYRRNELAGI